LPSSIILQKALPSGARLRTGVRVGVVLLWIVRRPRQVRASLDSGEGLRKAFESRSGVHAFPEPVFFAREVTFVIGDALVDTSQATFQIVESPGVVGLGD